MTKEKKQSEERKIQPGVYEVTYWYKIRPDEDPKPIVFTFPCTEEGVVFDELIGTGPDPWLDHVRSKTDPIAGDFNFKNELKAFLFSQVADGKARLIRTI